MTIVPFIRAFFPAAVSFVVMKKNILSEIQTSYLLMTRGPVLQQLGSKGFLDFP